jgi:hypothetical protein
MAKIRFAYAPNVNPEFATAAELRDSLLASYPDAAHFGGPVVGRNRDDTAPAWGWAIDLIRTRRDWWPALGIALQHAANDGGELARTALATLAGSFRDSLAVLPWTAPTAAAWPDARAPGSATGWGAPDFRLQTIVRDQASDLAVIKSGAGEAWLDAYGPGGAEITAPFTCEADLAALLRDTAHAGQFPDGSNGPWSWLGFALIVGEAWLAPAFVHVASTIDGTDLPIVLALLDHLFEQRDLWQLAPALEAWVANPPAWWATPAATQPPGWRYPMRSAYWPGVTTLGDVVQFALGQANGQRATPPVLDLPVLYA